MSPVELYDQVLHHLAEIGEAERFEEKCKLKERTFRQGEFEFAGTR